MIDYERLGKLLIEQNIAYNRYNDDNSGDVEMKLFFASCEALWDAVDEEMEKITYGRQNET